MRDQRRARAGAVAGDDVDHARRQPDRLEVLGQLEEGERRLLGRLDHDRAAGREGRGDLPRRHEQRIVPGDDLARHPDRLAHRERHRVGGHRQHLAVDLGGEAAVVLVAGGGVVHVVLGLDDRLARVDGLELGELAPARADPLRQPEQDPAALLRAHALPAALVEGAVRRLDRAVDVLRAAGRHVGDHALGGGVVDVEGLAALGIDELAVDVHLVRGDRGLPGLAPRRGRARHRAPPVTALLGIWWMSLGLIYHQGARGVSLRSQALRSHRG